MKLLDPCRCDEDVAVTLYYLQLGTWLCGPAHLL